MINGTYETKAGSIVKISGKYSGIAEVEFDWLEENACIDCEPNPYPEDQGDSLILTWSCDYCSGGHAVLTPLEEEDYQEGYCHGR